MPKRLAVALVALLLATAARAEEVPAKLEPYLLPSKALDVLTKLADASDVLVLGELHGTQETPTIAAALLAPLSQRGYRVLALEVPADEQQPLVEWAAGRTETVPQFFAKPFDDGRGNIQLLALIRTALAPPFRWHLVCFDDPWPTVPEQPAGAKQPAEKPALQAAAEDPTKLFIARDAAMAARLAKERMRLDHDAKVLAICGNFHARTSRRAAPQGAGADPGADFASKLWPSFAAALAKQHADWRVRSVHVIPHGGAHYASISTDNGPPRAGIHPIRSRRHFDAAEARLLSDDEFDAELNRPRSTPATFLAPPSSELPETIAK